MRGHRTRALDTNSGGSPRAHLRGPPPHRLGPRLIAGVVGRPHSTVHATLRRAGISRPPRPQREQVVRYEWPCPGDLLHMDTKRYARFTRPGHAKTNNRFTSGAQKRERVGYEFCHSIVDDHTRLAYSELHSDERSETVVAFTARALEFFAALGICPKRLMTDNAWVYVKNRQLAELWPHARSATSRPSPAVHRPTARSSASSRRWPVSGPTGSPTAPRPTARGPCHTGCATTTSSDPTHRGPAADQPCPRRLRSGQLARQLAARPLAGRAANAIEELGESVEQRLGRAAADGDAAALTRRETEVVRLVAEGRTNREIAAELFLSPRTVDMHVRNILAKLDCRSRVEASIKAGEIGLLQ